MKRNSIILPKEYLQLFISEVPDLLESNIEIRIDEKNQDEILSFLFERDKKNKLKQSKKFKMILYYALKGLYNDKLYGKEPPDGKNVTAMKFTSSENYRIVCKELFCEHKKIIMVTLFYKKSTKGKNISKRDLEIYNSVGDYDYDC